MLNCLPTAHFLLLFFFGALAELKFCHACLSSDFLFTCDCCVQIFAATGCFDLIILFSEIASFYGWLSNVKLYICLLRSIFLLGKCTLTLVALVLLFLHRWMCVVCCVRSDLKASDAAPLWLFPPGYLPQLTSTWPSAIPCRLLTYHI